MLRVSTAVAGTFVERFVMDEGAALAGLVVRAVTGTVTAYLDTEADQGETARVLTWPVQSAANGLLLLPVPYAMANMVVTVVTTGAAEVSVWIKPVVAESANTRPVATAVVGSVVATFGDLRTAEATPVAQLFLNTHADDRQWDKYEVLGGTVTNEAGGATALTTSTTAYSYAALLSAAKGSYRPGQAALVRGTAAFSAGGANTTQLFGPLQGEEGVAIGRNGTAFGLLHRTGRRLAIYKLDLTVGAGGAETATVTLNGTAQTVALTAGTTTVNARQVAERAGGYADAGASWNVQAVGATVYFTRTYHGTTAGAFSFTSTGTATGTFTQLRDGAVGTSTWTAQADWSEDPMDGTGPSGRCSIPPS